jgi:phosphatidylserine/phosphatidylglycerophosphate/cardiolipin synthase-like enzyme
VARGYTKALQHARRLVYVEDQYLWGHHIGDVFTQALRDQPELYVVAVIPMHPDRDGRLDRAAELLGRRRAIERMMDAAHDRIAVFGIENHAGTPIYVHAKTCMVDDTWSTIGSDNFNRRSWTHDSELSAVVVDTGPGDYVRRLRMALAAEHLDREPDDLEDCVEPRDFFATFVESARRLDAWHAGGRQGPRPAGRLRRLGPPALGPVTRALATFPYLVLDDPDGRPRPLRRRGGF